MRRSIMSIMTALLIGVTLHPANALPEKTLAIIDTGFNIEDSIISSHTVHEVCIMDYYMCPNGQNFYETDTAAGLTANQIRFSEFDHGSKMARAAIATNPNIKLVLIRIIAQAPNGNRMSTSENVVAKALQWVSKNYLLYNMGAVAMSQGTSRSDSNMRNCLSIPAAEREIRYLKLHNVYSFFPIGNDRRTTQINWPACLSDSVAVGGLDRAGNIADYNNYAPAQVDIYENGSMDFSESPAYQSSSGSSISVQVAAAKYIQLVNLFPDKRPSQIFWAYIFSGDIVSGKNGVVGHTSNVELLKNRFAQQ